MNAVPVDGTSPSGTESVRTPTGEDVAPSEGADAVEKGGQKRSVTPEVPTVEARAEANAEAATGPGITPDAGPEREARQPPKPEPAVDRGPDEGPEDTALPYEVAPDHEVPQHEGPEHEGPEHEGPKRSLMKRFSVWTPLVLLPVVAFMAVQALRPLPEPTLGGAETSYALPGRLEIPWPDHGQGAVRIPGTGEVAVFGAQEPVPTASVAKIMTAYVILKRHPLEKGEAGPQIAVDAKAVADGTAKHESRIQGLTEGATFSQQDMLKMLMIPSGNNVARLLARWDAGSDSTDAFVARMNEAARDLGMHDTTYTDPSGLDAKTVSTAVDQLKLAEAVMEFDVFRAIVAMPDATVKGLPEPLYNNNGSLLISGQSIRGIKTGSSTPAGGTLVWAAYKTVGARTPLILGSLMGQRVEGPDPDAVRSLELVKSNSEKVVTAVRGALTSVTVIPKGQVVGHVDDGLGGRTPLVAAKDLQVVGVPGQQLDAVLSGTGKALPRSAAAGTEVATLTVGSGAGAASVPVTVRTDLTEPTFLDKLKRLG